MRRKNHGVVLRRSKHPSCNNSSLLSFIYFLHFLLSLSLSLSSLSLCLCLSTQTQPSISPRTSFTPFQPYFLDGGFQIYTSSSTLLTNMSSCLEMSCLGMKHFHVFYQIFPYPNYFFKPMKLALKLVFS